MTTTRTLKRLGEDNLANDNPHKKKKENAPEEKNVENLFSMVPLTSEQFYSLKALRDGVMVGGSCGTEICLLDSSNGETLSTISPVKDSGWHLSYIVCPITKNIICRHADYSIGVWDTTNIHAPIRIATCASRPYPYVTTCFAEVSPTSFAQGDNEGNINVWDIPSQKIIYRLSTESPGTIKALVALPREHLIISINSEGKLNFFDTETQTCVKTLNIPFAKSHASPESLVVSHDKKYLYVVDLCISVIDLANKKHIATLGWNTFVKKLRDVKSIIMPSGICKSFTPLLSGNFAVGDDNGTIQVWDLKNIDKPEHKTYPITSGGEGCFYRTGIFSLAAIDDERLAYASHKGIGVCILPDEVSHRLKKIKEELLSVKPLLPEPIADLIVAYSRSA